MENEKELITYTELLNNLEINKSHLLLANGFNNSLGINTSYKNIFQRMIELYPDYKSIENIIETESFDLEAVLGKIEELVKESEYQSFLKRFISNKIKYDFMKSTYSIVKENLKSIYQENTEGIYLLFSKFQNYFTLNFDPLLYLLLMKFKNNVTQDTIILQSKINYQISQLDSMEQKIYKIIESSYNDGLLTLTDKEVLVNIEFKEMKKSEFLNNVVKLVQENILKENIQKENIQKEISRKNIEKIVKKFLDDIYNKSYNLDVNDGFQNELFSGSIVDKKQNVFFIHGSFHIYQSKNKIKKIVKTGERLFSEKLEDVIESEDDELIIVFQSTNKNEKIEQNEYLLRAFQKLSEIEGDMVIFGSSLDDNDKHIFGEINNNEKLKNVYISTNKKNFAKTKKIASEIFNKKKILYFDYETVSYSAFEN